MRPDDARAVYSAIDIWFRDHFGRPKVRDPEQQFEQWEHFIVDNEGFDPELVFVAEHPEDAIVGASVCRHRPCSMVPVCAA
jgi:hypothetical protein